MLKGVEVTCFFACYIGAFLFELLRFRFKQNAIWHALSFVLLCLGSVIHGVSLCRNDLLQNDHFFSSASGWFYVLAFGLVLALVYLNLFYSKIQFGVFLFPLTFTALILGMSTTNVVFPENATCRWIRTIHAGALLMATLISFLGAVAGIMFFLQRYRLKHKIFSTGFSLPSLEWLGCCIRHATNVAVLFLGIGVICGFYLKIFVSENPRQTTEWGDPVIIGATVLFFTALFSRIRRILAKDQDTNANDATLSFVCCVALILLLFLAAFTNKGHWRGLTSSSLENRLVPANELKPNQEGLNVLLRENDDGL